MPTRVLNPQPHPPPHSYMERKCHMSWSSFVLVFPTERLMYIWVFFLRHRARGHALYVFSAQGYNNAIASAGTYNGNIVWLSRFTKHQHALSIEITKFETADVELFLKCKNHINL